MARLLFPALGALALVAAAVDTDAYRLDADRDGTGCDRYPDPADGR